MMNTTNYFARAQHGAILLISLIVLVAMTMAGLALVKSVNEGNAVAGNLAFRMGVSAGAERAFAVANTWLLNQAVTSLSSLDADIPASGYYSTMQSTITDYSDPDQVDWDGTNSSVSMDPFVVNSGAADSMGNRYFYFISRMCQSTGTITATNQACISELVTPDNNSKQSPTYKSGKLGSTTQQPYYRITVRVVGPHNATSYHQAYVLLQ